MYKRLHIRVTIVCFTFFLACTAARAADYYVDGNLASACIAGTYSIVNRNCSGSDGNAYKTMQEGINVAFAGDSVYVRTGTYSEALNIVRSGSSESNRIILQNYNGESVVVDGSGIGDIKLVEWPSYYNYITWDGIDVRDGSRYGMWVQGNYNIIQNCSIHDNGSWDTTSHTGLTVMDGSYNIVRNCKIYNNGWNGVSADHSQYTSIENNVIYNNAHMGVNIFPIQGIAQVMRYGNDIKSNEIYGNGSGIYTRYQAEYEISNNLIYENLFGGIVLTNWQGQLTPYNANAVIYNNTVVDNTSYNYTTAVAYGITFKNNIFAYSSTEFDQSPTTNVSMDYNQHYGSVRINFGGSSYYNLAAFNSATGQESNGVETDPLFTNRAGDDYTLTLNSNAKGAGVNLAFEGIVFDLRGISRPQGSFFDIGCYEYYEGDISFLSPPSNLVILTK